MQDTLLLLLRIQCKNKTNPTLSQPRSNQELFCMNNNQYSDERFSVCTNLLKKSLHAFILQCHSINSQKIFLSGKSHLTTNLSIHYKPGNACISPMTKYSVTSPLCANSSDYITHKLTKMLVFTLGLRQFAKFLNNFHNFPFQFTFNHFEKNKAN